MKQALLISLASAGVGFVAFLIYLRTLANNASPVFTVEHSVEIAATPEQVWRVLTDFAAYPEWNPYILSLEGDLSPGRAVSVTIKQDGWKNPRTVTPIVVRFDAPTELHWHGSPLTKGLIETDHRFVIESVAPRQVRVRQFEEFRGWIPRYLSDDRREDTRRAFEAMNLSLAKRVAGLPPNHLE